MIHCNCKTGHIDGFKTGKLKSYMHEQLKEMETH